MPQLRTTSPRRIAGLVVASAALLVAAGACSGGTEAAPSGGGFTAYTECLKQNGVTITMPSGGARVRPSGAPDGARPSGQPRPSGSERAGGGFGRPAGVDDATWEKAQAACASVRPSGRPGGGNGTGRGDGGGMSAAYRTCLQDHGVTLGEAPLATGDPAVQKAVETCKALAPAN